MRAGGPGAAVARAGGISTVLMGLVLLFHTARCSDDWGTLEAEMPLPQGTPRGGTGFSPLLGTAVLGEAAKFQREVHNATMDAQLEKVQAAVANRTDHREKEKAELADAEAKKKEAAAEQLLEAETKNAAEKMSQGTKTSLSLVDKLARAMKQQAFLRETGMDNLRKAAKDGDKGALEIFETGLDALDEIDVYVRKLRKQKREKEEQTRILREGKAAEERMEEERLAYAKGLAKTRRALKTVISSGTAGDLARYLGLRSAMESSAAEMEKAQHKLDAATLVQEKMADKRVAESLRDRKDKNPRVAMMVWEQVAAKAYRTYKDADKVAKKKTVAAAQNGKFNEAKEARDRYRKLRLAYAYAETNKTHFAIKSAHQFAERILVDEKKALHKLSSDKALARALREKMGAAEQLQQSASDTKKHQESKQQRAGKNLVIAKQRHKDLAARFEELRTRRREAVEAHLRAFRNMQDAKLEIQNTMDTLKDKREAQAEVYNKKIGALKSAVVDAKAKLFKLKADKEKWEQEGVPTSEDKTKQPMGSSNADKVRRASEKTIKQLKIEQAEELKRVQNKLDTLRRGTRGVAEQQNKNTAIQQDQETEELQFRRQDAEEKVAAAKLEARKETMNKDNEIKGAIRRRTERRLKRITAKANKKLLDLEGELQSAKGSIRQRISEKIAGVKDRRDNRVIHLKAKMKRRLKRRIKRNEKRGQRKENAVVTKEMASVDRDEKSRILNVTVQKAEKAVKEVDDVRQKVIQQEFGVLAQKRRDIVEVTRTKVKKMLRTLGMTKDEITRHKIKDNIDVVRRSADTEIMKITKKIKDEADARIAKDAVKILRTARAAAEKRETRLRRFQRKQMKRANAQEKRHVEQKFALEKESDKAAEKLTSKAISKISHKIRRMETKLRIKALKKIEEFEKISAEKSQQQIDKLIKAQSLVTQAVTSDWQQKDRRTKFNPSANPYEGKPKLAKQSAEILKQAEKDVQKFKDKVMAKVDEAIKRRTLKIQSAQMEVLSQQKGNAKERQLKMSTLKEAVDRKIRRTARRLKRAERKADKSGKKVDRLKIERARDANDSAKFAADAVLRDAKRRKQENEREAKHRKVERARAASRRDVRRASAELEKAAVSGSRVRLEKAHEQMHDALRKSKRATEMEIDQVKQNGQYAYEQALIAGGSPRGGGQVMSEADMTLKQLNHLVREARDTKKESDYNVAQDFLRKAERRIAHLKRHDERKSLRALAKVLEVCTHKKKVAERTFHKARETLNEAERTVEKARQEKADRAVAVVNSKRALEIASVLTKIAKNNYMMMMKRVDRDKSYAEHMKTKVAEATEKIARAQAEDTTAVAYVTVVLKDSSQGKASIGEQIESEKQKIMSLEYTTSERIKEVKQFFNVQAELNRQMYDKPLTIDQQRDDIVKKIDKHAKQTVEDAENKISALEQEQAANSTSNVTDDAAQQLEAKQEKEVQAKEAATEAAIMKKEKESIKQEEKKMDKLSQMAIAAEKNATATEVQLQSKGDAKLKELELKKATASPQEKKKLEQEENNVRQKMHNDIENVKDKALSAKREEQEGKRDAKEAMQTAEKKAEDKQEEARLDAKQAKEQAKVDAQSKAESVKQDIKNEKDEQKKETEKKILSPEERLQQHNEKTDGLLKKLLNFRDDIEKALHYHLGEKMKNLHAIAEKQKETEIQQNMEIKQAEESQQIQEKMVEAENAAVKVRIDKKKKEDQQAKRVAHKVEAQAAGEEKDLQRLAGPKVVPQRRQHLVKVRR